MPVTGLTTSIQNFEGAVTFVSIGGGQGAATNADIFIEGTQSGARRVSNATGTGFAVSFAAINLSAVNTHVKAWSQVVQWGAVSLLRIRLSDGANADDHTVPTSQYPDLGGFIPVWIHVNRTPEVGGSANEASIVQVGIVVNIGPVGGNAQNVILDEITYGTSGLRWTGTSGSFVSFATFEAANRDGVLVTIQGVYFCYARLEIGNATATTFEDSGFQLVFPDQPLVSTTFMGITFGLQSAGTAITLSNAVITSSNVSGATRRFDITATGTSGSLDLIGMTVTGARVVTLTSAVLITGGTYQTVSLVQGGATIEECIIQTNSASGVATLGDPTFDAVTGLHDVRFVQANLGHAIEITGTTAVTLTNLSFVDYGPNGTNAAALFFSAVAGSITVNLSGTAQPTFRSAGVTVNFVAAYNLTLTGIPTGVQVTIVDSTTRTELFNTTTTGLDVVFVHGGGDTVDVLFNSLLYDPNISDIFDLLLPSADQTIPIALFEDRNYVNP